jgi:hypothetical protein
VRSTEGCCWKAVPADTEPERGQVPDHLSPEGAVVESKDVRHVLHEDVAGSKLANGTGHLSPENGLGMFEPGLSAGDRRALAGEAPGDDVDAGNSVSSDESYVGDDGDAGEAKLEEAAAEGVDLAQPGVLQPGSVQAVGEQAAAVEESADREHVTRAIRQRSG